MCETVEKHQPPQNYARATNLRNDQYVQQQFRWTFKHDAVRRDTKHNMQLILLKETSLPLCVVCVLFVLVSLCCSNVYICLFMGGCTKISEHLNGQQWACIVRKPEVIRVIGPGSGDCKILAGLMCCKEYE